MSGISNQTIKQYLFLTAMALIAVVLAWQLAPYLPGILGAITLYILMRPYYFKLTVIKNWKKWVAAIVFILAAIVIFALPIWLLLQVMAPKLSAFVSNPDNLNQGMNLVTQRLNRYVPQLTMDEQQIKNMLHSIAGKLPHLLGATLNMLVNAILALFLLYFMLVDGRKMERAIQRFLPLQSENMQSIWEATRVMVVSNAIGLPALAACEALTATLGYYLFNVKDPILWGVVTGAFSLIPIVGTAIIWIPMALVLFANNQPGNAIGLLLYATVMINLDHLLRFTLLKKIGNVHPVITALGILVGVPLFGFMGLIFGPLLVSYLLLLIQVYNVEFSPRRE